MNAKEPFVAFLLFVSFVSSWCSLCLAQTNLHSVTLTGWTVVTNSSNASSSSTNLTAPGVYVDFSAGNDNNSGNSITNAFKHCPGDPSATSNAAACVLLAGTNVFFKGGVTYALSPQNATDFSANQGGIVLKWNGAPGNPITYACTNAWGNASRAVFTDGYTSNWICAFYSPGMVNNVVFNNLEFGPIGGSASLPADPGYAVPPKPGAGILVGGSLVNVTIANCYFHQLGYWFNQKPMGGGSIWGEGIQCIDSIGLTITNCEFTKVGIALELPISSTTSNLTIAHCNFHDALVWCIDLAHSQNGCSFSGLNIAGNTFNNYCQQWNNWTGYGGWPHSDGIFDRGDSLTTFTDGTNNNVYNNVFFDSQTGASTADIYQEGGTSLNIYNNVFSTCNSHPIGIHADGQNATMNTNFLDRIYNNTFYEVNNTHLDIAGWPNNFWRTGSLGTTNLIVLNNLFYDTSGSSSILFFQVTNTTATSAGSLSTAAYPHFGFDYNCYRSLSEQFVWQYTTAGGAYSNTDIGGIKGYGWEAHGITNPATLFVDATSTAWSITNNYNLKAGSPCIGAGTNLSALGLPGLANDITGKPRPATTNWDIGAYQH